VTLGVPGVPASPTKRRHIPSFQLSTNLHIPLGGADLEAATKGAFLLSKLRPDAHPRHSLKPPRRLVPAIGNPRGLLKASAKMTRKLVYCAALVAFLAGEPHNDDREARSRSTSTDTAHSLCYDPDQYNKTQMDKLG